MDKIISWAGVDEKCQKCNKSATWRVREKKTGNIVFAACPEHKMEVVKEMQKVFAPEKF